MNVALVRHLMGATGVHGNLERHLKRGSAPAPRDGVCLRIVRQARIEEPGSLNRAHIIRVATPNSPSLLQCEKSRNC
jgi:hypothetical protein